MNELAVKEQEIEKSISSVQSVATSLVVISHDTYSYAGEMLVTIKKVKKTIEEYFNGEDGKSGIKPRAYATWKGICDKEKQEIDKLSPALMHLNFQMTTWNIEQEKIRKAEENRLRAEAMKKEEEDRLTAALQAEAEGNKEEAIAIIETPVFVPPPIVEKSVPKQAGITLTTTWRWRLKDINLVPRQFLIVNEVALNAHVKNLKERSAVPGIEIFPEQSMRGVRQ